MGGGLDSTPHMSSVAAHSLRTMAAGSSAYSERILCDGVDGGGNDRVR